MADSHRRSPINLEQDIVENGESYDFFQAVKLLEKLSGESRKTASSISTISIKPELSLDFPQSEIVAIDKDSETGRYDITTTFFGLYGVSSPLPGFYTEELLDDEWDELEERKAFFDLIHNHMYPLLYSAWLKYKFSTNTVEFSANKYWEIIFSLIGLPEAFRHEENKQGQLLKYAGILSLGSRSLLGLQTILNDKFGDIDIEVVPCVKRSVPIDRKQRSYLGVKNHQFGESIFIGQNTVDRTGKFSIQIGPLDIDQFRQIKKDNVAIDWIKSLLRIYLIDPLDYSIEILLKPGMIQPACIGDFESSVLGNNCWLYASTNKNVENFNMLDNSN
ncbi:MAG: type VI secretion system baseplate subunit TssG [Gammaproteobacteria bacterium]|nr:type VI secretion system baseplate subunit TssG [Gammaproteobacteria bacterium]